MAVLLIIIIIFMALFVIGVTQRSANSKKLRNEGFTPNINIADVHIDERHGLWNRSGMTVALKISEITDCEVIEDGVSYKSNDGVLRAVVGEALLGSVGAIVGAMTSSTSETIQNMHLVIHTNNPSFPQVKVRLIYTATSKSSSSYSAAKSSAESIIKCLEGLSGISAKKAKNAEVTSTVSSADELAKYKKLLDDGAITEEEYAEVKKKLLTL